jgi:hypothetical protein
MTTTLKAALVAAMFCVAVAGVPQTAEADLATLYIGAKGETFGGTGDVYKGFDNRFGGGVEAGFELLGIDLFGEAVSLGLDQYLFTANLGFDFGVGDDVRLQFGAFTGPIFFLFPEPDEIQGVDFSAIPQDKLQGTELSVDDLEAQFDSQLEQEKDLNRLAVGWNLVRLKMDADVRLAPGFYFGLGGSFGYHVLLSGEEIASGAKNEALERYREDHPEIPQELYDEIRKAVGAEPVDKGNLNGTNFEVNIHLRIEIGG